MLAAALAGGGTVQTPRTGCADPSRRAAAIEFARAINTAEAASFRGQRSYLQLGDLPVGTAPTGMTVQLSTDGETYAFSIKDDQDACHGAVFSDQAGVIYTGVPIG
jgi:hypothetical protein